MIDITKIRVNNITMDGYYFDDGNAFFKLSDQDILRLRKYYRDSHIAYKRQIKFQKQSLNNSGVRKYSLKHSNPYNYRHTKEKVKAIGKCVIIGGVLVSVITLYNFLTADKTEKIIDTTVITEADLETSEKKENYILLNSDNMLYVNDLNVQNTLSDNNIIEESNINKERQMIIKKYCDIYCVDYNVVYDKIVELTDNFMSEEYLNKLTIPGVKCKRLPVHGNSEEHLLLLAVRHIKQIPSDFNLTEKEVLKPREGLEETRRYDEAGNVILDKRKYFESIAYYADLFNLDRCLLKAIIQAESNFDSIQFNEKHNPAGLRDNGVQFRSFDGDIEGLIEFCTEMVKYYEMGAQTIADIRDIHAPLSDGNVYWLDNVTECYLETIENEAEYFGNTVEENILGGKR